MKVKEYENERKGLETEIEEKERKILECTNYVTMSLELVSKILLMIVPFFFGFGTFEMS